MSLSPLTPFAGSLILMNALPGVTGPAQCQLPFTGFGDSFASSSTLPSIPDLPSGQAPFLTWMSPFLTEVHQEVVCKSIEEWSQAERMIRRSCEKVEGVPQEMATVALLLEKMGRTNEARWSITQAAVLAGEIERSHHRSLAQSEIALKMAGLGMTSEARALITQAEVSAGKIEDQRDRSTAQKGIAVKMAELAAILKDQAIITHAAVLIEENADLYNHSSSQIEIALKMAGLGMISEARALIAQATVSAGKIEDQSNRSVTQMFIAIMIVGLGVILKDQAIITQAAALAGEIGDPRYRFITRSNIAVKMAELGVVLRDQVLITQAAVLAREIEDYWVHARVMKEIAVKMAELGVVLRDQTLIAQATVLAGKIRYPDSRSHAQSEIAGKMTELGMISEARALIAQAAVSAEIEVEYPENRYKAQIKIAGKMTELGMISEARTLIAQVAVSAGEINKKKETLLGIDTQIEIAGKIAKLEIIPEVRALIAQTAVLAKKIEDPEIRSKTQIEIAFKMTELGMVSEARTLFTQATASTEKIEGFWNRSRVQSAIAIKMAESGMISEARALIAQAEVSAGKVKDQRDRPLAQSGIAVKMAEFAVNVFTQAHHKIKTLGGWQNSGVQKIIQNLLQKNPDHWIPRLAAIPEARDLISSLDTPTQQLLALRGQAAMTLLPKDKETLRRRALKLQSGQSRDFKIWTTTLEELHDPGSAQVLLDQARRWEDPSDPRFPQLISRLLKTNNPKAINFCVRLLGNLKFTNQKEGQYRLWLLKKLCEAGHLEKELYPYVKKRMTSGETPDSPNSPNSIDQWIQCIVEKLGLTPTVSILTFFLEGKERDPSVAIDKVLEQKASFEKTKEAPALMALLAKDPRKAFLYFILFGGRTRFALIDRYTPEQFQKMVDVIKTLGPVDEGVMSQFSKALSERGKDPAILLERLREGRWPLADQPYAQPIRIDVSSESALRGLKGQFEAALSFEQLGAMIVASLNDHIPETRGLGELAQAVQGIGEDHRKLYEEIKKQLGDSEDIASFKVRIEKELTEALKRYYRSKNEQEKLKGLKEASAEDVLVQWIEMKIKKPLKHADEWKSHIKTVFDGVKELGMKKGEKEKTVTLRYLDKRQDLSVFLRFADAAQCCFTSEHFEGQKQWLTRMWKDPMSFVFLIEDNKPNEEQRNAVGFVFGSFGIKDDKPVILLNGVYLQGKTNEAVLSILNTIEEDFSKPIGATHQFVAATHGGQTHLDAAHLHAAGGSGAYDNTPTKVTRLRALADPSGKPAGKPETKIYDDIGVGVNEPKETGMHVWRKGLSA